MGNGESMATLINGLKPVSQTMGHKIANMPRVMHTWREFTPEVHTFIREKQPNLIVEVGAWLGYSTEQFAQYAPVITIDTWLGALEFYTVGGSDRDLRLDEGYPSVYYQFAANMYHGGVADRIYPVTLPSVLGLKYLKEIGIVPDLVYIDGSHEYSDVASDYELARRLGTKWIIGDDYGSHYPGVQHAVDDLSQAYGDEVWTKDEYYFITVR